MPRNPILYRESFYEIKRSSDGDEEMWDLDWNLVNTLKGAMIEPRLINPLGFGSKTGVIRAMDEQAVNKRSPITFEEFARTFFTWGRQLPVDYTRA